MRRFGIVTLVLAALVVPLSGAQRARYDYYLTGNGNDAIAATGFGVGLIGRWH